MERAARKRVGGGEEAGGERGNSAKTAAMTKSSPTKWEVLSWRRPASSAGNK